MAGMWHKIKNLWGKENLWSIFVALIFILLAILSTTDTPLWIYQGF